MFTTQFKQELIICCNSEINYFKKDTIAYKNAVLIKESVKNNTFNKIVLEKIENLVSSYKSEFTAPNYWIEKCKQ